MSPYRRVDRDLRAEGLASLRAALYGLYLDGVARNDCERRLRSALGGLVEAFLEDRRANSDLFVLAHLGGLVYESEFGCRVVWDPEARAYWNDCPVAGLHSRMGLSIAFVSEGHCSICGAGDFECDHVEGWAYGGQRCQRIMDRAVTIDHASFTSRPDFTFTFRQQGSYSAEFVERQAGEAGPARGQPGLNHHCRDCYGRNEVHSDDVDTALWDQEAEVDDEARENLGAWSLHKDPGMRLRGPILQWGEFVWVPEGGSELDSRSTGR